MKRLSKKRLFCALGFLIFILGLMYPQKFVIPVEGADKSSYNPKSFWHYPWGESITHKGVDIFAEKGTPICSATDGFVFFTGKLRKGGNAVAIIGPKWRIHYYAHLKEIKTKNFSFVTPKKLIGTVGTTGNAVNKPPHLHYSIITTVPYPWKIDKSIQGWKKMFFLNPIDYLR